MRDAALIALIHDRYAAVHGAIPASDYPTYLTIGAPDVPQATLGYRLAAGDALFLEAYLDRPVEIVLTEAFGRPVPRARIVELGDHASRRAGATLTLWHEAAAALAGQADVAVAVLTRPLRSMFARLGVDLIELAPARIDALGEVGSAWGRYYQTDPVVCAGDIAACRAMLDRSARA